MGRSSPADMAMVRKFWLMRGRAGRPKEMLDTPSTVLRPNSVFTRRRPSRVCTAPSGSAETVRVRQSMYTSSLRSPKDRALSRIFRAMSIRAWTVLGMPFPSSVRPTTAAPYFFTRGRMASRMASSPFTELTMALPQ